MSLQKINTYTWPGLANRPLLVSKRFHFRGQKQHLVYFRFLGADGEIKLDLEELVEWKWVDYKDLEKKLHPEKLALAKIVSEDLKEMMKKAII